MSEEGECGGEESGDEADIVGAAAMGCGARWGDERVLFGGWPTPVVGFCDFLLGASQDRSGERSDHGLYSEAASLCPGSAIVPAAQWREGRGEQKGSGQFPAKAILNNFGCRGDSAGTAR